MTLAPPLPGQSALWANCTIGILGGSFNPAHEGHRHITLHAIKRLGLDAVWWMVSPQNPLKPVKGMADFDARMDSARTEAKGHPKIVVTDIEIQLGTRYTADTLPRLQQHFPTTRFIWLMGADNLHQIHKWERWADIFETMPVCVLDRPPARQVLKSCPAFEKFRNALKMQERAAALPAAAPPAWCILHIPLNAASSTAIRRKNKKKQ